MVKTADRDLLVISKQALLSEDALQDEILFLNGLLHEVEVIPNIAHSIEIFDLNKFRIIDKYNAVVKHLGKKEQLPFTFVSNKN